MPTNVLGVSAFYHDSAAALVRDGEIVAAAQEERFTRRKHDAGFPQRAVDYCLDEAGLAPEALDYVVFYEKPLLKLDRLIETYLAFAPRGFGSFRRALPLWMGEKLRVQRALDRAFAGRFKRRFLFTEHHEAHAASAFFPSPFDEAAILTMDGVGEWATAAIGVGRGRHIELTHEMRFPHSPGLLYSAFTYYCGFRVNGGEYKLMGLAPYGAPRHAATILRELVDLRADGSLRLDMRYFDYAHGLTMTNERFHRLFGAPPRRPEEPLAELHMDLAASIQQVTEEIVLRMARHAHALTGLRRLCMAGGVALNCVANGRLAREGPFERVWAQPAAGDAGGAVGAALFAHHQLLGGERRVHAGDSMRGCLLGPAFGDEDVRRCLDAAGAAYEVMADEAALLDRTARLLADGKVVGWFQGRMEYGPRALGARSILADPRPPDMQRRLNQRTKFRESFRPFAPSVLAEAAGEWFDGGAAGKDADNPYMLFTWSVKADRRLDCAAALDAARGTDKLHVPRSVIPAVTHVDFSARAQSVDAGRNARYHALLRRFRDLTGCPVLVNTSFNVRGEPIVCSPADAWRCFAATDMDALAMGRFVLLKERQPESALRAAKENRREIAPD
jgi:carbamoyltransferase